MDETVKGDEGKGTRFSLPISPSVLCLRKKNFYIECNTKQTYEKCVGSEADVRHTERQRALSCYKVVFFLFVLIKR